jgi:hypothetical protein
MDKLLELAGATAVACPAGAFLGRIDALVTGIALLSLSVR